MTKILLLILLPFISFAQDEVKFNELPKEIRTKIDSTFFISAYMYSDSTYEVELGVKKKRPRIETTYSKDGEELDTYYYKAGSSPISWCVFYAMLFYMGSMFF
jgi:hypothetical protein